MPDRQVDGDDAVFDLAQRPAVLPLDAGGFVALLGHAGLVDQPDRADPVVIVRSLPRRRQVLLDDAALEPGQQAVVVPHVVGEELLQRPHRRPGRDRDRLDALARQVADQPPAVGAQVRERVLGDEAGAKAAQVIRERRPQRGHLFRCHP